MKTNRQTFFPSLPLFPLLLTFLTLFVANVATAQVPSYVPTNGLVGYWPFNGNANDESGNGNNGTVIGATLAQDRNGNVNAAYSFDGNDWVEVQNSEILNFGAGSFTLSCWSQKLGGNTWQHMVTKNFIPQWPNYTNNFALRYENNTIALFSGSDLNGGNGGLVTSSQLNLEDWNHFVGVFNSTSLTMHIYMNGTLIGSTSTSSTLQNYNALGNMYFGVEHPTTSLPSGPQFLTGFLDDISIYNRALTTDEVLALYNGCNVAPLTVSGNVTPTQFTQETYTYPNTVGSTYNWTVTNGVIVSGQGTNSIDVVWANSGIGSVSVVETNGTNCSGDVVTYDVVIIPTDVEEFSAAITLFPNPATNEINLQTTTELIGSDLIIFDALGKQIHKQQILSTNTRINTTAFAAGNYVVRVGGVVKRVEVRK